MSSTTSPPPPRPCRHWPGISSASTRPPCLAARRRPCTWPSVMPRATRPSSNTSTAASPFTRANSTRCSPTRRPSTSSLPSTTTGRRWAECTCCRAPTSQATALCAVCSTSTPSPPRRRPIWPWPVCSALSSTAPSPWASPCPTTPKSPRHGGAASPTRTSCATTTAPSSIRR